MMVVGKGLPKRRVTEHFNTEELMCGGHYQGRKCPCRYCGGDLCYDIEDIYALESLRCLLKLPIYVLSPYRCADRNDYLVRQGIASPNSRHVFGQAYDIRTSSFTPAQEIYQSLKNIPRFWDGGIGLYPSDRVEGQRSTPFVHVDHDGGGQRRWVFWRGQYIGIAQYESILGQKLDD